MLLTLAGCTAPIDAEQSPPTIGATSPTAQAPTPTIAPSPPEPAAPEETVVRFSSDGTVVDVTIAPDSPAASDFISMLPLTLTVEEYGGREKISYLPRSLDTSTSAGSTPVVGDLSYYAPWGNLVFYYNTDGIGYSDQTIHLGTYSATPEQLALLEGSNISVKILD